MCAAPPKAVLHASRSELTKSLFVGGKPVGGHVGWSSKSLWPGSLQGACCCLESSSAMSGKRPTSPSPRLNWIRPLTRRGGRAGGRQRGASCSLCPLPTSTHSEMPGPGECWERGPVSVHRRRPQRFPKQAPFRHGSGRQMHPGSHRAAAPRATVCQNRGPQRGLSSPRACTCRGQVCSKRQEPQAICCSNWGCSCHYASLSGLAGLSPASAEETQGKKREGGGLPGSKGTKSSWEGGWWGRTCSLLALPKGPKLFDACKAELVLLAQKILTLSL